MLSFSVRSRPRTPWKLLCGFSLVLLFSAQDLGHSQTASVAPKWTEFHSKECHFKASFPGTPTDVPPSQIGIDEDMGGIIFKMYIASTTRDIYMVSCMVFPPYMKPRGMEYLEKNRDTTVAGVKGTLLSDRATTFRGNPAREFSLEGRPQTILNRAYDRTILIGQSYFMLAVTTQPELVKGFDYSKEAQPFYDSFDVETQ